MTGENGRGTGRSCTGQMTVKVRLESILARHAPENPAVCTIPPGATLHDLIKQLGLREDQVMFAFVNGRMATLHTELADGAAVSLCPYICGG